METPNTYNISLYRKGYIVLKEASKLRGHEVKYDAKKNKHFISGHITVYDHWAMHAISMTLPKPEHICILPTGFEKELHIKDLKRFLFVEVAIIDIEYIVLTMASYEPEQLKY